MAFPPLSARARAAALALGLALCLGACEPRPKIFSDTDGAQVDFKAAHGRWTLINYWAPWCAPCREEIPELNEFQRLHADEVMVLGVHLDNPPLEKLRADREAMGIRFRVLSSDPGPALGLSYPAVVPMTRVLDPDGRLRDSLAGPQTIKQLRAAVDLEPGSARRAP